MTTSSTTRQALLTAAAVGQRLAVDERTVRQMTREGRLPAINLGTPRRPQWRYDPAEIEKWLAARRRPAA